MIVPDQTTPYTEEDLLPLSGLQHLIFCERRAALVHLERLWAENVFTAEGNQVHQRAHDGEQHEVRGQLIISRGLAVRSLKLGLSGQCDVVEFHQIDKEHGCRLPGRTGRWMPTPVEYKRGKRRAEPGYLIQLCAQAICLEEMLGLEIEEGAIYFSMNRRRMAVSFDLNLRNQTVAAAARMHELFNRGTTPAPVYSKKCEKCSLIDVCQPRALMDKSKIDAYIALFQ